MQVQEASAITLPNTHTPVALVHILCISCAGARGQRSAAAAASPGCQHFLRPQGEASVAYISSVQLAVVECVISASVLPLCHLLCPEGVAPLLRQIVMHNQLID